MKGTPQPDGSVLTDVVTKGENGGANVTHKCRFTLKPPHAQIVEMIDGPTKARGSR